jgi:hypothetical protein
MRTSEVAENETGFWSKAACNPLQLSFKEFKSPKVIFHLSNVEGAFIRVYNSIIREWKRADFAALDIFGLNSTASNN